MRIIVKPKQMTELNQVTVYKKKSHHHVDLISAGLDGLLFYISNESDEVVIQINNDPNLTFIVIKQKPHQLTSPMDVSDRIKIDIDDTLGNKVNREFLRTLFLRNIYDEDEEVIKLRESFGKYVTGSLNTILVIVADYFSDEDLQANIRYRYNASDNILDIDKSMLKDIIDLWENFPENKARVKPVIFDATETE